MDKKIKISLLTLALLTLALLTFIIFIFKKSNFGGLFEESYNCQQDNRIYPQGNIPGSYLGLNKFEKEGLLTKFIMNSNLN